MTKFSRLFTVPDIEALLKAHGARQWRIHFLPSSCIRILVNWHIKKAYLIPYTKWLINELKPEKVQIELVQVEEFLSNESDLR